VASLSPANCTLLTASCIVAVAHSNILVQCIHVIANYIYIVTLTSMVLEDGHGQNFIQTYSGALEMQDRTKRIRTNRQINAKQQNN